MVRLVAVLLVRGLPRRGRHLNCSRDPRYTSRRGGREGGRGKRREGGREKRREGGREKKEGGEEEEKERGREGQTEGVEGRRGKEEREAGS